MICVGQSDNFLTKVSKRLAWVVVLRSRERSGGGPLEFVGTFMKIALRSSSFLRGEFPGVAFVYGVDRGPLCLRAGVHRIL